MKKGSNKERIKGQKGVRMKMEKVKERKKGNHLKPVLILGWTD